MIPALSDGNFFEKVSKISQKALDILVQVCYTVYIRKEVNRMNADKMVRAIKEAGRVVDALVQLAMKVGTLLGIIKMILDSLT